MEKYANSSAERFESFNASYESTTSPHERSRPLAARSQGRYGSRSVERSLQHPVGFHNPLKSLSPLALRLAKEDDTNVDVKRDLEPTALAIPARSKRWSNAELEFEPDPKGLRTILSFVGETHSILKTIGIKPDASWTYPLQVNEAATDSITGLRTFVISSVDRLRKNYPHSDDTEDAMLSALMRLMHVLTQSKGGNHVESPDKLHIDEAGKAFLSTLGRHLQSLAYRILTAEAGFSRSSVKHMRYDVERAVELLECQKDQIIKDWYRRWGNSGSILVQGVVAPGYSESSNPELVNYE